MKDFEIIVLGPLFDKENIKDGMIQRIAKIDELIENKKRLYVEIAFKKYFLNDSTPIQVTDKLYSIKINIFRVFLIYKLIFNVKKIYIHSLYNIFKAMPWILFTKAKVFFDLHGIVPEEEIFRNRYIRFIILSFVESVFFKFRKNLNIIYVTESMKNYMKKKYKFTANEFVVPIFPKNLSVTDSNASNVSEILQKYNIKNDDTVFIYSGNTQKWQKIPLMLTYIKSLSYNEKYKFLILTGEYEEFQKLLANYDIKSANIFLDSVSPDKLSSYYELSHYGFLLRDRHPLNNVACPTKAIEYLFFGITPIVLEENIGDFKQLGYEYIPVNNINSFIFEQRKSKKNTEVAKYIKEHTDIELLNKELNS